jgi:hypothetical protein
MSEQVQSAVDRARIRTDVSRSARKKHESRHNYMFEVSALVSDYRACTVDFAASFFDTTRGGKQTNALSCR